MVGCSIDDGSKPMNCESSPVTKLGLELLIENGSAEVKLKEVLLGSYPLSLDKQVQDICSEGIS